MARLWIPVLVLLGLLLLLTGFDRPKPKADFSFINRGDVSTLDPATVSWMQDLRVMRMIGEGLTRNNVMTDNYETVAGVAERWEISEDGRVYTFHLRANALWNNGAALSAHDFLFSWRRALMPDVAGDYIKLFALIRGGKEFIAWRVAALRDFTTKEIQGDRQAAADALWEETKARFGAMVAIEALDERTLRVTLERPTPYFLTLMGFPPFFPTYPPVLEAHTTIDAASGVLKTRADWTKPGVMVTNGAYRLTVWQFKREMRFEQNPHYWDRANLAMETIAIPSVQDANAQVLAFRTGAVDWVSDVTPSYRAEMLREKREFYAEHAAEVERIKTAMRDEGLPEDSVELDRRLPSDPRAMIHAFPAFGTYFYNFNCLPALRDGRPNPFRDARVRRAFAMALDKQATVENITRSGEPPATTLIPPRALPGYVSPRGVGFDPEAARALLAEAGYPGGAGLPVIEILFNKEGGHDLIAQAVAKDWEKNLGVRVSLAMKEIKVFREDLKSANYMVSRAAWFGDYGDPTTFLDLSETGNGNNDRKFSDPAYDALLARARDEVEPMKRLAILSEAEKMIVEDQLPMMPIYHYVQIYMFDPHKLTGISSHPRQEQQMERVDVLGDGKGAEKPKLMRRGDPGKGTMRIGSDRASP
jgi:oligopeptide transport system substrate-binding protein